MTIPFLHKPRQDGFFRSRRTPQEIYMQKNIEVGRYLVSPMTSSHIDGGFSASVSIRSGRGTGTTDRIMRFSPRFPNRQAALRYATAEGLSWVRSR